VCSSDLWARSQALAESIRIAYADARGIGPDEEVGEGPGRSPWLDPSWGADQARKIRLGRAIGKEALPSRGRSFSFSDRDTTHLSVVDREGNAVSLTQSLGRTWGSTWVTPGLGFPYNAFLEGYDLEDQTSPSFLRPNAATRTSVAPTILLRDGRPVLVLGAAGSTRIAAAIANVVVAFVDGRQRVAEAVAAPRTVWSEGRNNRGVRVELAPPVLPEDVDLLRAAGYADLEAYAPEVETANFGALNAVGWDAASGTWEAGADPRRRSHVAVSARPSGTPVPKEAHR
jgi:gamma-glutamyltranspeptidase